MSPFTLHQSCVFLETVSVSKAACYAFLYQPRQINNIVHFCCTDINAAILAIDTTFNLCTTRVRFLCSGPEIICVLLCCVKISSKWF